MTARYDLHTHSVHSDGTTTPEEIVAEAAALGLAGISLTDHDTLDGWAAARRAAAVHGIDFLPGMEITTRDGYRSTHLLAYGIDPDAAELRDSLARVRESRHDRAKVMVQRLAVDFDLNWEELAEAAGDRTLGRPHIADALVASGYYKDRGAAFEEVLHPRSKYYVPTYAIETTDAVRMVREAGGMPVLAHPAARRMTRPVDIEALQRFVAAGLGGIELEHPENRTDWLPPLAEFAAANGLLVTGSSDFHGAGKPNKLGERSSSLETLTAIRGQVATPR